MIALTRIFKESESVNLTPRHPGQSPRDYPIYTVPQAASYLAVPERTLRYWVTDHPLWPVAGAHGNLPLMSFRDIAQAYYIEIVRRHFHLSVSKTREVLINAQKESKARYPLLRPNIRLFFKHILMDKGASGKLGRRVIDLSQHRQLAIDKVADQYSTRVRWDTQGEPSEIFPWRHWIPGDDRKPVSISPNVMSGNLVITGTRIPVQTVLDRKNAGESIANLASDYGLSGDAIVQALEHLVPQAA